MGNGFSIHLVYHGAYESMLKRYLILENIRSAYNVGAIFRTADAAGVRKIYLTGYTPQPIDRFSRVQPEIEKTSLGASSYVPWEHVPTTEEAIVRLQKEDVTVVAVEQTEGAISLPSLREEGDTAYLFGNETEGVSEESIALADGAVFLPMLGKKESLNVSVCVGIVLYQHIGEQLKENRDTL